MSRGPNGSFHAENTEVLTVPLALDHAGPNGSHNNNWHAKIETHDTSGCGQVLTVPAHPHNQDTDRHIEITRGYQYIPQEYIDIKCGQTLLDLWPSSANNASDREAPAHAAPRREKHLTVQEIERRAWAYRSREKELKSMGIPKRRI